MNKAVFLDRDGVIVRPVIRDGKPTPPLSYQEFEMLPGVEEALQEFSRLGFLRILVTNQPDIAYGKITRGEWERIQSFVEKLPLDDIYICFHGRDEGCDCKKPKPGMVRSAAEKWKIDLSRSYLVGDTEDDTETAGRSGCKSILVCAPYNKDLQSDYTVKDLREAASLISGFEAKHL